MTNRINKSMERHKKELEQNIIKFSKWHDKRLESLLQIYNSFCDYLDFMRRTLYVKNDGDCLDAMHAFHRAIEQQIVHLDDSMAEKVQNYQGELLVFWNWSVRSLSERGEEARQDIRHRLDYEIPAYLPRLRKDINEVLDPNYKSNGSKERADRQAVTTTSVSFHHGCG